MDVRLTVDVDRLILVSLDDHVIEPPHLFTRHLPALLRDRAPRFVEGPEGPAWVFGKKRVVIPSLSACAGKRPGEYDAAPLSLQQLDAAYWDVGARLEAMDTDGIFASLCFPHMAGLAGQLFAGTSDPALAVRMIQAYNDWYAAEWSGLAPDRLLHLAVLPIWDVALAVAELRRVAGLGARALSFPEHPVAHGLPSIHDTHWTPLWTACDELGVVVCLHVGSGSSANTSADAPPLVQLTLQSLRTIDVAADLVWSGLFLRYPHLQFCLPSHGADWLGSFLRRVDATDLRHRSWGGISYGDRRPSEVFRARVLTCFIEDEIPAGTDVAGIAFSSDYPHADSPWPRSPETVAVATRRLSEADRAAVTHDNAVRSFRIALPSEDATVGRLRARRKGTDD